MEDEGQFIDQTIEDKDEEDEEDEEEEEDDELQEIPVIYIKDDDEDDDDDTESPKPVQPVLTDEGVALGDIEVTTVWDYIEAWLAAYDDSNKNQGHADKHVQERFNKVDGLIGSKTVEMFQKKKLAADLVAPMPRRRRVTANVTPWDASLTVSEVDDRVREATFKFGFFDPDNVHIVTIQGTRGNLEPVDFNESY